MRRSPADSTNRSLAAFGKLQHIDANPSGGSNAWRLTGQHSQQSPLDKHRSICEIPRVELDIDEAVISESET